MSFENPINLNYEEFFKRIENADILPKKDGTIEVKQEKLQELLETVFKEYGELAIKANNGKIFTTLSGGLDSTLALALLRKIFPNTMIETFTMGGDQNHPDIQHSRLAAKKFESVHHEFIPTPDDIQNSLYGFEKTFLNVDVKTQHGDFDVFMLYEYIKRTNPQMLIVHDGIDELMGGYWAHRKEDDPSKKAIAFTNFWIGLVPEHLKPLTQTTNYFGINLLFPYLDQKIISVISQMPLDERTTKELSKIPLRNIAQNIGVPQEIIDRPKRGQVGMLDREGEKSA